MSNQREWLIEIEKVIDGQRHRRSLLDLGASADEMREKYKDGYEGYHVVAVDDWGAIQDAQMAESLRWIMEH